MVVLAEGLEPVISSVHEIVVGATLVQLYFTVFEVFVDFRLYDVAASPCAQHAMFPPAPRPQFVVFVQSKGMLLAPVDLAEFDVGCVGNCSEEGHDGILEFVLSHIGQVFNGLPDGGLFLAEQPVLESPLRRSTVATSH
eukprot:CAMPEP_0116947066 /NCGR_PEP_ID=MMETSP0467-20121206/37425_1 /TAXON_ID=283647 /ORGANISM="Mesodinium pulex, Strain SPMC105" /LENGTH=138 /DNA_ID=CAMNT_0004631095 /DNA_START=568 /DNA_END=984 /DNA_ORIENTATION=+